MAAQKTTPIYKKRHASGREGFRVDMGILDGKPVFRSFPTLEAAERLRAKCLETDARNRSIELRDLSEMVCHEVLGALEPVINFC